MLVSEMEGVLCSVFNKTRLMRCSLLKSLIDNLICVNIGLKPSFLWDLPERLDRSITVKAISLLKENKLISEQISVLILADDLFIVNVIEIETLFCNALERYRFVDCSPKLDSPQLLENQKDILVSIELLMNLIRGNKDKNLLVIEEKPEWYLPSLFGFLLGYPVVYWSSSCENNLANEPLHLFKINYSSNNMELKNIYSFTVPSKISLIQHIDTWKKKLNDRFPGNLTMTESTVSFPSIIL